MALKQPIKELTTSHLIAIKWLALPNKGGKTYKEVAQEAGIHVNTLDLWRKDPLFDQELKKEMVRVTHDKIPKMMESMVEHAIKGNAAMAKLVLQSNEMLDNKVRIEMDNKEGSSYDDVMQKLKEYQSTMDNE